MEQKPLGTVQWPDLNLPAFDARWSTDPAVTTEDAPRVRRRWRHADGSDDARNWQRRRRTDGAQVLQWEGTVELANQADFGDFDFRVRMQFVDQAGGGVVLAPVAVAVIVRTEALGTKRGSDFARAGIARAITEAARHLSTVSDGGVVERAATRDVAELLPRVESPSRHRSTREEVKEETLKVVKQYRELLVAAGGDVPRGYARSVASKVYGGVSSAAQEKVRKRLQTAVRLGLVKPAVGPGSKRRD